MKKQKKEIKEDKGFSCGDFVAMGIILLLIMFSGYIVGNIIFPQDRVLTTTTTVNTVSVATEIERCKKVNGVMEISGTDSIIYIQSGVIEIRCLLPQETLFDYELK